jgi:hypothetical protein
MRGRVREQWHAGVSEVLFPFDAPARSPNHAHLHSQPVS